MSQAGTFDLLIHGCSAVNSHGFVVEYDRFAVIFIDFVVSRCF